MQKIEDLLHRMGEDGKILLKEYFPDRFKEIPK